MSDKKPFLNCLRAQIFPDEYAKERIESIASFCERYGFQNVILIFNGEEHNVGHIKKEELVPWIETIKEAKKAFEKRGISTSLNPWMEIGHLDRGRSLQEGQNFVTMEDRFGNRSDLVACPLDPNWRKYYLDEVSYYVSEVKPLVLWIEDDYRFHNHDPLSWGGCFCSLHMDHFNAKLGKKESREEFVAHLEEKEPTKEREVWLSSSFEILDDLAKDIQKTVAKASPNTNIGLMSSTSYQHAMEGREWEKLHKDLCTNDVLIDRIHLPAYREVDPKSYYFDFNRVSMVNRSFLGDDVSVYPELENSSFSTFVKDWRFLSFQLESALPLGLSGMTYNIFAHVGNGVQEEFGYGEAIKALCPYLNAVKDLELLPSQMRGLLFPLDEKTVYHERKEGFLNLVPTDYDAVGYFSSMGFSYRISKEKRFEGETIVLTEQNVWNFSNEELIDLFKDNFVLLDGMAASILIERGLGSLISALSAKLCGSGNGTYTLEMYEEGVLNGMHNYKATSQRRCGKYYSIDYGENVRILSGLYDPKMNRTGNGVALGKNFMVYPYSIEGTDNTAFFMPLRRFLFEKHLLPNVKAPFCSSCNDAVYPYLFEQKDRFVLFLTNANYYGLDKTSFLLKNVQTKRIEAILHDGSIVPISFEEKDGRYTVDASLDYLSTLTLLIEK